MKIVMLVKTNLFKRFINLNMEAVQYLQRERKLEFVYNNEVPKVSGPNDVLVKVLFSGICEMDVNIIDGIIGCNKYESVILGHEICGVVSDIGTCVTTVGRKNRVVVDPYSDCGICACCRSGKPQLCNEGCTKSMLGIYLNGGWAEYVLAHQKQVFQIPDMVTLEQAAITEPLSYVAHGWSLLSPIPIGKKILVIGLGLIGLLWVIMLHYHGHKNVTVVEPNLARHEYVQQLEIKFECISPRILGERHSKNSDYLFDLVLASTTCVPAIEKSIYLLRPEGKLCLIRTPLPTSKISISPWTIQKKQLKIIGIDIGGFSFTKALEALEFLGERYISFSKLGIKTYPLNEYRHAVDHVRKSTVFKAMFRLPDDCHCKYAGDIYI